MLHFSDDEPTSTAPPSGATEGAGSREPGRAADDGLVVTHLAVTHSRLESLAEALLPTQHGAFRLRVFRWDDPEAHPGLSNEHIALTMGNLRGRQRVPVRVHSECLTSEVFGSLKCDCRSQLDRAQKEIAERGFGAILYLRQEGRGIGLANKIRAYALQERGADTVEANQLLHLPVDARQYDVAEAMIRTLGIRSVLLMTNNPAKVEGLCKLGVEVVERLPVFATANPHSASYLEAKRRRMQHEIPSDAFHAVPSPDAHPELELPDDDHVALRPAQGE